MVDEDLAGLLFDADLAGLGAEGVFDAESAASVGVGVGVAREAGVGDGMDDVADGDAGFGDVAVDEALDGEAEVGVVLEEDALAVVVEVVGVDEEGLGGGFLEHGDGFVAGADEGASALGGEHGADGLPFPGAVLGVDFAVDADLGGVDLEGFAGDLLDGHAQALADFGAAHVDDDGAVGVHLEVAGLGGEGGAFGGLHQGGEAAAVVVVFVFGGLVAGVDGGLDLVLAVADGAVGFVVALAGGVLLAGAEVVFLAEVEGGHVELAGEHVHEALDGEVAFLVAVAAEGADGGRVGVDALGFEQGVREFVGAGAVVGGGVADVDAGVGEGAGGVQDVGLDGDEGAVLLGADLHVVAEAVADEGAGEVFAAGGDPLDGAAGDVGGDPGDGLLDGDVGLVAEAAADFGDAHADHGGGLVVGVGEVVADDEGADGGGPGVDGAVFVEADDGAVGLDGGAGAVGIDEFAFDDDVGFGEAFLDVALLEAVGIGDVGAGDGAEAGEVPVVFGVVVDQDGVLGEGLAGVGVDGQGLVFDLDAFEGFDGVALGVGDDGGDVVADVADLFDGHGGDVADVVAVEGLAVAAGDDLDDAGHFFGGGGVDGEDFGVGEVGVEDGGVEEAGEADVVEVLGFADGFGDGVGAGEGFADVFEFGHGGLRAVLGLEWGRKIARGRGAGNREGGRSGRRRGSVLAGGGGRRSGGRK